MKSDEILSHDVIIIGCNITPQIRTESRIRVCSTLYAVCPIIN